MLCRNYWKGRNYDPIYFEDFCDNKAWILEDDPILKAYMFFIMHFFYL